MPLTDSPAAPPLLLVDAGNTRTKIGLFADADTPVRKLPVCEQEWILEKGAAPDWDQIRGELSDESSPNICLTGSNPQRVSELTQTLPGDWPRPSELPLRSDFPLRIEVDYPDKVGIDRLLNAIAANWIRRPGQAAVLLSSGTATTIDYVSSDGAFCGGAILPGFEMSARALHEYTALLPLIPLDVVLEQPPDELGRNTEQALRSGLYWGHIGAVRELLRRFMHRATIDQHGASVDTVRHLGNATDDELPLVILTGGAAPLLQPHLPSLIRHQPQLALQGLALLCRQSCVEIPQAEPVQ